MKEILELRQQYGLSRKELCEMLEIPYRTLQDWELGNAKCPPYVFRLIAHYLKTKDLA